MGRSGAPAQAAEVWPILERDGVRRMGWGCFALHAEALLHAAPGRQGMMFLRSAPVQGVNRPPHTASRDCQTAHPLPVRTRVRLHRNAGSRGKRKKWAKGWQNDAPKERTATRHLLSPIPHAAQRAVPGWRGGLGRVGADLASAGSMRPPPSPARYVSTARLATTYASRETGCHHTRQAISNTPCMPTRHGSPPHTSAEKQHATTPASRETDRHEKAADTQPMSMGGFLRSAHCLRA